MKRWQLTIVLLTVVLLSAGFAWHIWKTHERKKREVTYQAALSSYSKDVKPGMTRKEVEGYLRGRNVTFRQMCCFGGPQHAWADLVRIGQESSPWYCSENNVYVAFKFAATDTKQRDLWENRDSDQLLQVTSFHWLEGCL